MRVGTRVGQAYIALTADGSGINEDIANSFDGVDYKALGDEHGQAYADRLRGHLEGALKDMEGDLGKLGKAFDTDSSITDGISKQVAGAFDDGKLDELIKRVGRSAGTDFGHEFDKIVTKSVLDTVEGAMNDAVRRGKTNIDLTRGVEVGGGDLQLPGGLTDSAVKLAQKRIEDFFAERERLEAATLRDQAKAATEAERIDAALWRVRRTTADAYSKYLADLDKQRLRDQDKHNADLVRSDDAMWRIRNASAKAYAKYLGDIERGTHDAFGNKVSGNGRSDDDIGNKIGKLLGAGSRNNALNLFGKSIGGVINLVDDGRKAVGDFFNEFTTGFKSAEDGASGLEKVMSGLANLGGDGGGLLASFASAGPQIGVTVVALSALVSVLSALLGIVVALAATIASALVAALLVAGAALAAAGAAAGLLVIAFTSLDSAQKNILKNDFLPIKQALAGIGQELLRDIIPAFHIWAMNIENALVLLEPLARVMSGAFAESGNILSKSLSGPGFQEFIQALTVYLPAIVEHLTGSLGGFLNGMLAVFAVLLPYVLQFAKYLDNAATSFANWAESAKGQNAITSFVDEALVSLHSLLGFLGQVGGLLSDLLFSSQGQGAGNNLFDAMAASIARFRASISGGDLTHWFAQAVDFGHAIGTAFAAVATVFNSLVSDGALAIVIGLLSVLSDFLRVIAPLLQAFLLVLAPIGTAVGFLATALSGVPAPLQAIVFLLPVLLSGFGKLLTLLPEIAAGFALVSEATAAGGLAGGLGAISTLAPGLALVATRIAGVGLALGGFQLATKNADSNIAVLGGSSAAALGVLALGGGPITAAVAGIGVLGYSIYKSMTTGSDAVNNFVSDLNNVKVGGFTDAIGSVDRQIHAVKDTLSSGDTGSGFVNFFKELVDSDFRQAHGNLDALNDGLATLKTNLIKTADALGINTEGWDKLNGSMLEAKGLLTDHVAQYKAANLEYTTSGALLTNLHNSLTAFAGASYLNISKTGLSSLLSDIDSIDPKKLDQINARIRALFAATQTGPDVAKGEKAMQAYLAYLKQVAAELGSGNLTGGLGRTGLEASGASSIFGGSSTKKGDLTPEMLAYYDRLAASIEKNGPTVTATIRNAILTVNKQIASALVSAARAGTVSALTATLQNNISAIRTSAEQTVNTAQQAVNTAAQNLASQTTIKGANKALADLHKAQANLSAAIANQHRINAAAKILKAQEKVTPANVTALIGGFATANATLADYAAARAKITTLITAANTKLAAAISLRDNFKKSVIDSATAFAALTTAQGQTINGLLQQVTANDITTNLQTKLDQIKAFQTNLNTLLAEGLSNDAYKQLVNAGVDGGGAYASALVAGGASAVANVNGLTAQITAASNALGTQSSNILYQAGVNAAQGLVDGLKSQAAQLDAAATQLGNAIALAVKKSLGIHSPSTVLRDMMDPVGDGAVQGLDAQHGKVGYAAARFASKIAVSPEAASYATGVSGNSGKGGAEDGRPLIDASGWQIHTPTEDPEAVAAEVLADMTGKLL